MKESEKDVYCMALAIRHAGKGKTVATVERSETGRGRGQGSSPGVSTEDLGE